MEIGQLLTNQPRGKELATLVLAHGAGGPMDSPFLNFVSEGLANAGIRVVRFEFPYTQMRRTHGTRKGPDPPDVLKARWHAVIEELGGKGLVIGGKSLGGRIASMIADEAGVQGLVCLGYPFHPPGQPDRLRISHLADLRTPTLIVQGDRDPFGMPLEVAAYKLSERIRICWIEDGDHSLRPGKKSGRTAEENLSQGVSLITQFIVALS